MKFKLSICATVLFSLSVALGQVASHQQAPPQSQFTVPSTYLKPAGKPVVRVNGVVLTDEDLVREEYAIFPYAKQHGGKIPVDMEPGIRKGALQMIVFEELVYQDAQKRGVTISPERISKAEADFRRQFDSPAQFQQYLQSEFQGNEKALREKIKRSLLIEQLLKTDVESKSTVSAAEVRAYYDKNPTRFQYQESFAIQTISIIPPDKATPGQLTEAKKRAEDAYKQAKATKTAQDFGLLAEKISDDDYRVMMGDHKWLPRDKMPPEMLQPALKMKDGEMSGLIQVGPNYVIFRMNRHVPAGKTPFEQVKVPLRKELEKGKTEQVRTALDKRLHQNAKVETL
ncbi:MAG: peptidyl-prolyl cis-trans isomerase [Terracidiphilus sp.]|jgi:peptidyl-prolyl cis-trans isomerase C